MNLGIFRKDKLILGTLAGILSDLVKDFVEVVFQKMGFINYTLDQFAGSMFIREKAGQVTSSSTIIGLAAGVALCTLLGVIFVYVIHFSGFRFVVFKGFWYGFILWFLIYGGAKSGLHLSYLQDYNFVHTMIFILPHLIFGLTLGFIVFKVGTSNNEIEKS